MTTYDNAAFEKDENKNEVVVKERRIDFKHLNENYDAHLDKFIPKNLHRGDVVSVNRFLGYHDPMMATCGTFLMLPLRNLNKMVTDEDFKAGHLPHGSYIRANTLGEYLSGMATEFVMFFLGFLIICTIWEANTVRTLVLKRIDDFLVTLGLLQFFVIIVLPFSMALQGHFPHEKVAVIMTVILIIIISSLEILMVLYGFANPQLLHFAVQKFSTSDRRRLFLAMIIKPVFDILLVGIAGTFALFDYRATWILFALMVLWPLFRQVFFHIRRNLVGQTKAESCQFFWFFTKGQISKERVEVFTEAAVAIIACVLILDITVEEFPSNEKVAKDGLLSVLNHMSREFMVFFGVYIGISYLWYINHTVLYMFHTLDNMAIYLQKIFLASLCMIPIGNAMVIKFGPKENHDSQVAILWMSTVVFVASMTQLSMLFWGYYRSKTNSKLLHKWATNKDEMNKNQRMYTTLKCFVIPLWAPVSMIGYFTPGRTPSYLLIFAIGGSFLTFLILKYMYMNHCGKKDLMTYGRPREESTESAIQMKHEVEQEIREAEVKTESELEM